MRGGRAPASSAAAGTRAGRPVERGGAAGAGGRRGRRRDRRPCRGGRGARARPATGRRRPRPRRARGARSTGGRTVPPPGAEGAGMKTRRGITRRRPFGLVEAVAHEGHQRSEAPVSRVRHGHRPLATATASAGRREAVRGGAQPLSRHAGLVEGGHLVQDPRRGLDERQRQRRARALAEAQVEVEDRVECPARRAPPPSPGSTERWPAITQCSTPGTRRLATSRAAAAMTPSIDHRAPGAPPRPTTNPASAACSRPPTSASTARASSPWCVAGPGGGGRHQRGLAGEQRVVDAGAPAGDRRRPGGR